MSFPKNKTVQLGKFANLFLPIISTTFSFMSILCWYKPGQDLITVITANLLAINLESLSSLGMKKKNRKMLFFFLFHFVSWIFQE